LRGLIQDHVIAGVKLTKRDTFLEKWEYQQLLFAALASLPRLELIRSDSDIEMMPPAVLKPRPLWTGKQVISTLLNHLRKGNDRDVEGIEELPGISTERKAQTPGTAFGMNMEEHLVIIRDGELLRGVLDKAAFGATDFCLVHAVFEAYGPEKAGLLLNSLGRLFTAYIQYYAGHSCRMEDLVLTSEFDQTRRNLVQRLIMSVHGQQKLGLIQKVERSRSRLMIGKRKSLLNQSKRLQQLPKCDSCFLEAKARVTRRILTVL